MTYNPTRQPQGFWGSLADNASAAIMAISFSFGAFMAAAAIATI
jgi:hypothetical protein